jgi:hypothetical protein
VSVRSLLPSCWIFAFSITVLTATQHAVGEMIRPATNPYCILAIMPLLSAFQATAPTTRRL